MIPVSKIVISRKEENAVVEVLRSGQIAHGLKAEEFESNFAKYIGTKYAVAVSNGTVALHLAYLALGLKTGDEVITTPYSFIASVNSFLFVGATPIFVDIGEDFNIDASKVEEKITDKTKAIMPVDLYGNPCEMDKLLKIGEKYKIPIIEDACQAHGAEYKRKKIGSFGKLACFSFYATKNMTTGEGGMITTNDKNLYKYLKTARVHGSSVRYYHKFLGYNYRMTDIQAVLGIEQLKKLDEFNEKRIKNAEFLSNHLKDIKGIITPEVADNKKHVFHQYAIRITEDFLISRAKLIEFLKQYGIGSSITYPIPIHLQEEIINMGFGNISLPAAEELSRQVLCLPVHPYLTQEELKQIVNAVNLASKN